MEDFYNLYIVYSTSDVQTIFKCLYSYIKTKDQIGPLKKDFTRNTKTGKYVESNRTIILIKKSLYQILKREGFGKQNEYDFMITDYQIREDNHPPKDSVPHLFFPINTNLSSSLSSIEIIETKLKYLSQMKMISLDSWIIKKEGLVIFTSKVDILDRIKIKIILDDVEDGFRVSWCKKKFFHHFKNFRLSSLKSNVLYKIDESNEDSLSDSDKEFEDEIDNVIDKK